MLALTTTSMELLTMAINTLGAESAPVTTADPVDAYWAAYNSHNAGILNDNAYIAALHRMDDWEPQTCRDFVRKFYVTFVDRGCPNDERLDNLVTQSRRLLGEARHGQD